MDEKLMRYFKFDHLPQHLQEISRPFAELAEKINSLPSPDRNERSMALRKLLEAKDAAVRSMIP